METPIPNLPTELESLVEEVGKLYRTFVNIVNLIITYFDKIRNSYLEFHTDKIMSIGK